MKVSFSMLFSKSISVSGRLVHAASVFYLLLPAVLFAFGWLRAIWLLPVLAVLALCGFTLVRSYWQKGGSVQLSVWYMLLCAAAVLVWLAFSGIGGFSYQNLDYYVRNPILNDLTHFSWPLRYDLSAQPDAVQALCGSDPVGFVYYFVFWLPAAALGKVFGAAQLWLFVWCFAAAAAVSAKTIAADPGSFYGLQWAGLYSVFCAGGLCENRAHGMVVTFFSVFQQHHPFILGVQSGDPPVADRGAAAQSGQPKRRRGAVQPEFSVFAVCHLWHDSDSAVCRKEKRPWPHPTHRRQLAYPRPDAGGVGQLLSF